MKVLLGVASNWDSRKGLAHFLELENLIPESYCIVLVGLSKEQIQSMPNCIVAIERTNSVNEMREIYGIADIFVNPTLEDNFPTTNLEARACGTPVITYDTGGSPESAGEDAMIVRVGDIEGLKNAIDAMTKSSTFIDSYSFSKENMAEQYINIYKKLSGSKDS